MTDGDGSSSEDPIGSSPLPDGTYDAIVVDADDGPGSEVTVHLAVMAGDHKGQVIELRGPADVDPMDLLAVPATITVVDGSPSVRLEY